MTVTTVTINGLNADSAYQVQVRATSANGDGEWSESGSGRTLVVEVPSNWGLIPSGLGAGDSFRLIFATSGKRNATATDIADYNSFVQTAAAAGHADIQQYSSWFRVVGSTADVDARDNTATTYTADDKGVAHLLARRQQGGRRIRGLLRRNLGRRGQRQGRVRHRPQHRPPHRHLLRHQLPLHRQRPRRHGGVLRYIL